jgi:glycine/D-amino acid oxidase-like deaminating enzyme/nitrite reductase/ring-hydroxylating ferredoxin subunit
VWTATTKMPNRRRLERDLQTEVCIVGAGIAGLSIAYTLAKAGKAVAVLDDGGIASGMTSVTTAHLATASDDNYETLEKYYGEEKARLIAQSYAASIDRIEQIVSEENIDCDFARVDGYLFVAPGQSAGILDRELAACHRAGLVDVEKIARAPLTGFDSGPCLRYPRQAQFHPLKYLVALTRAIERAGGHVFTRTHVEDVHGGSPARVFAGKRTVTAEAVVVATNAPVNDRVAVHAKQAPYMTYVIGATIPRDSVEKALYWDTEEPYHYVRTQNWDEHTDILIVGGEDHATGEDEEAAVRQGRLEQWARARFPMIRDVKYRWGGQVMEPYDCLAFIGKNPRDDDNVYVVSGDSGQGITHGTIAGMVIPDLVLGRDNPWTDLYSPSRVTLAAAVPMVTGTLRMASRYVDHLTPGEVESAEEIPKDSGAVMRRGLHKLAVYRDEEGKVHEFSAVCPHLGCIVAWNDAEKSWDCPCHGSRFEKLGALINGPANTELKPNPEPPFKRGR